LDIPPKQIVDDLPLNLSCDQDDGDLGFSLSFQSQQRPCCLLCQCQQTDDLQALQHLKLSRSDELDLDSTARSIGFSFLDEQDWPEAGDCELQLVYQSTTISVQGRFFAMPESQRDNFVEFVFNEPDSMQAKMILQLVRICQMQASIKSNTQPEKGSPAQDQALIGAAKNWTEKFAAKFSSKFENKN